MFNAAEILYMLPQQSCGCIYKISARYIEYKSLINHEILRYGYENSWSMTNHIWSGDLTHTKPLASRGTELVPLGGRLGNFVGKLCGFIATNSRLKPYMNCELWGSSSWKISYGKSTMISNSWITIRSSKTISIWEIYMLGTLTTIFHRN